MSLNHKTVMSQIPKASIYTKKGDRGTTSLVDGSTVPKSHPRVWAYGDVDELNSFLGVFIQSLKDRLSTAETQELNQKLLRIQNHLFNIGSLLACDKAEVLSKLPPVNSTHVEWLEKEIDLYTHALPALREFILPGGHESSAWAHVCRTVCRRAERHVSALDLKSSEYEYVLIYLNRLSDFFFTLARWVHQQSQTPEVKWDSKA